MHIRLTYTCSLNFQIKIVPSHFYCHFLISHALTYLSSIYAIKVPPYNNCFLQSSNFCKKIRFHLPLLHQPYSILYFINNTFAIYLDLVQAPPIQPNFWIQSQSSFFPQIYNISPNFLQVCIDIINSLRPLVYIDSSLNLS